MYISIHAPRVRCDIEKWRKKTKIGNFNPRTSCEVRLRVDIFPACSIAYFNPRTSCEVRPVQCVLMYIRRRFQSTHLVWGATSIAGVIALACDISIHAPRVRCDFLLCFLHTGHIHFNPRTSCEVRLIISEHISYDIFISIHAPRVRCDQAEETNNAYYYYFNPRTSCEVRQQEMKRVIST